MKSANKSTQGVDRTIVLSTLWIFALFNSVYADILTLYFGSALQRTAWQHLLVGQVGSRQITQGLGLIGAIVLEVAVAMVLLSRVLPYAANRWANIVAALIQTANVAMGLVDPLFSNLFYFFFSAIGIACTLFIAWYAWTWPRPTAGVLPGTRAPAEHQKA